MELLIKPAVGFDYVMAGVSRTTGEGPTYRQLHREIEFRDLLSTKLEVKKLTES